MTITMPPALLPIRWLRSALTLCVLGLGLLVCSEDADARAEETWSFAGSPNGAISLNIADSGLGFVLPEVAQPTYPGGTLGDLFNRPGLVGGFAAGFLGAGVVGLLFGRGMVGELSGTASCLGLMLQLALIAMLARLIWTWWRADAEAFAHLSPRQLADTYGRVRHEVLPDTDVPADAARSKPGVDAFEHGDGVQG